MEFRDNKSVDICRIALKMSISSREEEKRLIKEWMLLMLEELYPVQDLSL